MTQSANLGFPRIGRDRALKRALEAFWAGKTRASDLAASGVALRHAHWAQQKAAGVDIIPCGDFSFYDQMLDMVTTLGAVPARYRGPELDAPFARYFAMARGTDALPAMEMTKWFDTNYHYIVPELSPGLAFCWADRRLLDEYREAVAQGIAARPVIIGPITFLRLAKVKAGDEGALDYLDRLLPVYAEILAALRAAGADWVQVDEPAFCLDLEAEWLEAAASAYEYLAPHAPDILLATYFGTVADKVEKLAALPVSGLHLDLVRAPGQLDAVLDHWPRGRVLSLGLVDGRNIWRTDLTAALVPTAKARSVVGSAFLQLAPSCSLLHVPVDLAEEEALDAEVRPWLAFAVQKLDEVVVLSGAADEGREAFAPAFHDADDAVAERRTSRRVHNPVVAARLANERLDGRAPRAAREVAQAAKLALPAYPTTTIGSFPQTQAVRQARATYRKGVISDAQYDAFLRAETEKAIRFQEEVELDVLVHGEFERNDMVEYFGELLEGFIFTKKAWVQSYGSRCVKPPIIFGDVSRPVPMTVKWSAYAQSLTDRPVKGMLTGPVTILQWSFVRDDQPREATCRQIAHAIHDEVRDLEAAGIGIIQIDEPALREGLPLRQADWQDYLDWAVDCFRISACAAGAGTQIHTHMCYAEFEDILPSIAALDADVISIEASRSGMELLGVFREFDYRNEIGLGVYDIHSPRCPEAVELREKVAAAANVLRPDQLWVNPDCGLKTRAWDEVKPALGAMVAAAKILRSESIR